jgi:hypothetical protein
LELPLLNERKRSQSSSHDICMYACKPLEFSEFSDRELSSRTSEVFGFSSILVGPCIKKVVAEGNTDTNKDV